MASPLSDEQIRDLHARFLAQRSRRASPPAVGIETVQALAEGTYRGDDRLELLDRILAHPVSHQEFQLFRDLARAVPAPSPSLRPMRWALAAILILTAGVATLWQVRRQRDEPLRAPAGSFALVAPRAGEALSRGTRFVWRAVAGALEYRLELVDEDGSPTSTLRTADTTAILPDSSRLTLGGLYQVRVVAILRDGTEQRTRASSFTAR